MKKDVVDLLLAEWQREKPQLQGEGLAVVARIINLANRYEQDINRLLKSYGINYTDFDVLATLRRKGAPFRLSPSQLQEAVILSSGAMTACLKRLEKQALLFRSASDSDRRGVDVQLTARGVELVDKTIPLRFKLAENATQALSAEERDRLALLLRKLSIN